MHFPNGLADIESKWELPTPRKHSTASDTHTHTLIDDLRDAGVQDSLIKTIVGHEDSAVTFGVYGSRTPLKAMQDALKHIR